MVNFEHRFESKRMQKTHIRFFRVWTISHQKAMNWKLNQYCNLIVTIHDVLLSELQHLIGARNDFLPKEYLDTIRMPGRILEPVKLKIYRSFHQLNGILSLKTRSSQFIYRSDNFLWIFSAQICSLYSWIYRLIVYSLSLSLIQIIMMPKLFFVTSLTKHRRNMNTTFLFLIDSDCWKNQRKKVSVQSKAIIFSASMNIFIYF